MQELDCWVSANGKEIVLNELFCHGKTKWYKANWEKENARMNKNITPVIWQGKQLYPPLESSCTTDQ